MSAATTAPSTTPGRLARRRLVPLLLAAFAACAIFATSAASAAGPVLRVTTSIPDHVNPGQALDMYVNVIDVGDEPLSGNLTIKYTLPAELSLGELEPQDSPGGSCTPSGQINECVIDATGTPVGRDRTYRTFSTVDPAASGTLAGEIEVSGAGASNTVTVPFSLDTPPIGPFAIKGFGLGVDDNPNLPQPSQAASAPSQVSTATELLTTSYVTYNFPIPDLTLTAPPENFRDVIVHVPPGLVGNPTATPVRCTAAQLSTPHKDLGGVQQPICPRDSQVGLALLNGRDFVAVYNLVPPVGVPAELGFYYQGDVVPLRAKLRPSDNGIDILTTKTPSSIPISKFEVSLWGTPSDSSHDGLRAECSFALLGANGELCPSQAKRVPFLRTPTSCSGPLPWSIEMDTYQHPGTFVDKETTSPALENCAGVPFDPSLSLTPSAPAAHTPSGLDVNLSIPQENSPDSIAEADLKQVALTLPQDLAVNPAAAEGLQACSDAQLRLGLEGPSNCPDAAKLGTVELKTPLLEETLAGSVYLRSQASQDPESGEMYRLAIELRSDQRGVDIKLPGQLRVNPNTGQLTTVFTDLPQLPFASMQLHLNAGPRAPLSTPQTCGDYAAKATLTGWNGKTVAIEPGFSVNQNCTPAPFDPGFEAGVASSTAGAFSPFTLRVTRDPGMPNLSRIDATLPEGELAKLAGVPLCPDAQAASGSCPASSQVGRVIAAVGEGSSPLYLPQPGKSPTAVYLAGPYNGAPYSVIAAVPAQSGPFDLGTVTVRSALRVDPVTTQATVVSDPLPQIYGGIPVTYRDVRVQVDRPNFTLNPTNCEPLAVSGAIASTGGQVANVSDRFQMTDCAALGFKPKLALALKGGTRRSQFPALRAVLKMPGANSANIARAAVTLPPGLQIENAHINQPCTRVQFNAEACPANSILGHAKAVSPLLDSPLEGPVYFRSNGGEHLLPDIVADLRGAIHVVLVGHIDAIENKRTGVVRIRNTFETVPDAPVSRFELSLFGGKRGYLVNNRNLCKSADIADVKFDAQNGKIADSTLKIADGCKARGSGSKKQRRARR